MNTATSTTLHQICQAPSLWGNCIEQISALWQPGDALILLGPAAQGIFDQRLTSFNEVYVLQADLDVLGLLFEQIEYRILNYDEWAKLVLLHKRHITWK